MLGQTKAHFFLLGPLLPFWRLLCCSRGRKSGGVFTLQSILFQERGTWREVRCVNRASSEGMRVALGLPHYKQMLIGKLASGFHFQLSLLDFTWQSFGSCTLPSVSAGGRFPARGCFAWKHLGRDPGVGPALSCPSLLGAECVPWLRHESQDVSIPSFVQLLCFVHSAR